MKIRLQKKLGDLYRREVNLFEDEYSDRWDFENAVAELNFYLSKTRKTSKKIRILRDSINWDQQHR